MNNKLFYIIISILIIIIIASIIFFNTANFSPKQAEILENCKTLIYNGEDKINIVFFSPKEQTKKYSNFLLATPPFDKNKDAFNFYYIADYSPACELYQGIAILCYSKELIKKASSCPNDYIVVLEDSPQNLRSSAYMNVMSLNINHPLSVFAHEFGHAFVNFAEEYVPAKIPSGSKNCVSKCGKFEPITDECFQGCSEEDYYRSIENGIMRTLLSKEYGKFDENLIQEKINEQSLKITGFAIDPDDVDCSQENYYLIEGKYGQEISILERSIEAGCVGENGAGGFAFNLILDDNSILTSGEFNPELIFTDSQNENQEQIQGEIYNSDITFLLKIPIIENSKTLEIIKDEQKISEINLEDMDARPCKIK